MSSTPANSLNITQPGNALFDASSSFFAPNKILTLIDDFITTNSISNNFVGQLLWTPVSTQIACIASTSTNPGLLSIPTKNNGIILVNNSSTNDNFVVGGGEIYSNYVFDLVALSNITDTYTAQLGFADSNVANNLPPARGIYFQYTDSVNSGNWQIICNDGALSTIVNTSIPASTGFHNYGIRINAAGTSVSFTIDGVSAGAPITTHIPSLGISPFFLFTLSAGNPVPVNVDLFYLTNILTTAR